MKNSELKEKKQREAIVRQQAYNKLATDQKIAKLDEKLGKDIGAKKERKALK